MADMAVHLLTGVSSFVGATFDPAVVGKLLVAHCSGDRNEQPQIWTFAVTRSKASRTLRQAEFRNGVTLRARFGALAEGRGHRAAFKQVRRQTRLDRSADNRKRVANCPPIGAVHVRCAQSRESGSREPGLKLVEFAGSLGRGELERLVRHASRFPLLRAGSTCEPSHLEGS